MLKAACKSPGRDSHSQRKKLRMRYSPTRPPAPTEAHGCEQLAQSCYSTMRRPRVEPATSRLQVQHSTATLPSHPCIVWDHIFGLGNGSLWLQSLIFFLLLLFLFVVVLLSDFQSTKTFSFHNRSSLNFVYRLMSN